MMIREPPPATTRSSHVLHFFLFLPSLHVPPSCAGRGPKRPMCGPYVGSTPFDHLRPAWPGGAGLQALQLRVRQKLPRPRFPADSTAALQCLGGEEEFFG